MRNKGDPKRPKRVTKILGKYAHSTVPYLRFVDNEQVQHRDPRVMETPVKANEAKKEI